MIQIVLLAMAVAAQSGMSAPDGAGKAFANPHFKEATLAYASHDYQKAVSEYQTALEELKKDPGFERSVMWRVLLDNLGMAYGLTGDLANAKATFELAIAKDPSYPLFHYNLACTYGEMGDRDRAIGELERAFSVRANVHKDEQMPDPARDASFARFMKDETFVAALARIRAR